MIPNRQNGFTLIEAIIAMVITGIVAGIVATFMARPIQSYLDSVRRVGMTDVADLALRRMAYDIRLAVPNSVRVDGSARYVEFIPTRDGGRYRAQRDGTACPPSVADPHADPLHNADDCFSGVAPAGDNNSFDVLGPPLTGGNAGFVVIFNTGQNGLDAYRTGQNRRELIAANSKVSYQPIAAPDPIYPPFDSPYQRFQIVPQTGPVSFGCVGAAPPFALHRFTDYRTGTDDWSAQPTAPAGTSNVLLASDLDVCNFEYLALSASNALLIVRLSVLREGERVSLVHQIHVDNTP